MTTIILAIARDGAIGHGGDLLWRLSPDLHRFKALTMGHTVIMGRRTWASLPHGALPGRRNIVVTSSPDYPLPGAERASSLAEAMEMTRGEDAFIIGGAMLYNAALDLADRLELTRVNAAYLHADTRMDDPSAAPGWIPVEIAPWQVDDKSGLRYRFETYRREGSTD